VTAAGKAVLFDYGNVLVRWDPRTLYRKLFSDPAEMDRFLAEVCTPDWHLQHDLGEPMVETTARHIAAHPEYAAAIRAWADRFGEMIDGEIEGAADLIDALRAQGFKIGVLTNMPADKAWDCLKVWRRWEQFDTVVVTGFLKTAKPQAHAYRVALAALETEPANTFFVDDSPKNTAAANALGMPTHLFAGDGANAAALANALRVAGFLA
jgi:2-haloacid dehalogenase/putative hydrolase of the HAD superfamily